MKKVFLILIFILFIVVVPAYTPTCNLCYDENGRGIECYDSLCDGLVAYYSFIGMIDEFGLWNRTLSLEQVKYLYNSGLGRAIIIDLCYTNGFGEECLQFT